MVGADLDRRVIAIQIPEILVELRGDALDAAAIVREYERRPMARNLAGNQAIDRWPDGLLRQRAEAIDRADDPQIEVLSKAGIDDRDRPFAQRAACVRFEAAEVSGGFFKRSLRGGQSDASERPRAEGGEAFEQQGKEHAALVRAQSVDLVDDAVGNTTQRITGFRGQDEV